MFAIFSVHFDNLADVIVEFPDLLNVRKNYYPTMNIVRCFTICFYSFMQNRFFRKHNLF